MEEKKDEQVIQPYLERVEAVAMMTLTQSILEKDFNSADRCIQIMRSLSIV